MTIFVNLPSMEYLLIPFLYWLHLLLLYFEVISV